MPRDWIWARGAVILAELNAALGRADACARWYETLAPHRGRTVLAGGAALFLGAIDHDLGLLADATGRPEAAREHLEDAVALHERLGAHPWTLRSRFELARVLRGDPARHEEARALAAGVQAGAGRLGMTSLADRAAGLLDELGRTTEGEFRRAGITWTISYAGRTVRLADAKSLHDLAVLLSRPGRPVPAAELVARSGGGRARAEVALGADPVLDEQAKRAYRGRLAELDARLAEADELGDADGTERARAERAAVARELATALGLGGRDRGLGDPAERARKAVTERIRYSIARIARVHPVLADHLRASVVTGTSCAYAADEPVTWRS